MRLELKILIRKRDGAHFQDKLLYQATYGEYHALGTDPADALHTLVIYLVREKVLPCA